MPDSNYRFAPRVPVKTSQESNRQWDVSSSVLLQSISVVSQGSVIHGLFFRADGLKMYLIDQGTGRVSEWDLSTAWSVITAVFLRSTTVPFTQDTASQAIFFRADGLKMYIIGVTNDNVNEYDLSTAWNVTTVTFLQAKSIVAQDTNVTGVFFRDDGLKMYLSGQALDFIYEYDLSTAWNVTTAVFLQSFAIGAQDTQMQDVFFRPDGLKMYCVGQNLDNVYEYNLSTAWNISTAVFLQSFSVAAQDGGMLGIFFRSDGYKMYLIGAISDRVYEYNLGA